ncbi:MAG: hypothetical protein ACR2JW_05270 [Thermomicrobiales bacterium]
MADEKQHTNGTKKPNGKPISLYPLTVEQVVKAMLETPPPKKPENGHEAKRDVAD